MKRLLLCGGLAFSALTVAWACGHDESLREYLDAHFWLPFAKGGRHFEKKNVRRVSEAYAGMGSKEGQTPLARLRAAYQAISPPTFAVYNPVTERQAVAVAHADASLTPKEREEVDLIDAKIDMRSGTPEEPDLLRSAQAKLEKFLRTAKTQVYISEGRGWLAY
ncbi:MAG: hypothetical protein ABI995_08430, partial [Acidobacteriota bacterium]